MEVGRDAVNSEHSGSFVNILVPCVILSKLKISSIGVVLNFSKFIYFDQQVC